MQELLEQFPIDEEQLDDEDDVHSVVDDVDNNGDSDYKPINEFSDGEDMLEGIRGTVDKVVGDDLDGDSDNKGEWFDGEMGEEIIFSNEDIEGTHDENGDEEEEEEEEGEGHESSK